MYAVGSKREVPLRVFWTTLAALLLGCGTAAAQLAPPTPGAPAMGATSPLGIPGATSSVGPVGIPMGATELSPGGLSPAPLDPTASSNPCFSAGLPNATTSTNGSTFDGGGGVDTSIVAPGTANFDFSAGAAGLSGSCGPGTSAGTASGTSSASSLGGATPGGLAGSGLPLGATELNNAGVSPTFSPSIIAGPCSSTSSPSTMSAAGTFGTAGAAPTLGC
jgi:hypothetical protein